MPSMQPVAILKGDLDNPAHQAAVLMLVDAYSRDPMGAGRPLPEKATADIKRAIDGGLKPAAFEQMRARFL